MRKTARSVALVVPGLCATAWAHPGHDSSGFASGIAHPLSGLDHLLAMVAVGLWAAQLGGRNLWRLPTAFIVMMLLGGGVAVTGAHAAGSSIEHAIIASVIILGALVAMAARLPALGSLTLVGACAMFHGYAHVAEMDASLSHAAYAGGFVLSTGLLLLAGIGGALWARRFASAAWIRVAGAAASICGGLLAAGVL